MNTKLLRYLSLIIAVLFTGKITAQISFSPLPSFPQDNIVTIEFSTAHNEVYAATTSRVFVSKDLGATWIKLPNPVSLTVNTIYCTKDGVLYIGVGKTLNNPIVGLLKFDREKNSWVRIENSPLDISAICEQNDGSLLVGTGNSDNYLPLPINKGTGFYRYGAGIWSLENNGFENLPDFNVFPAIRTLHVHTNGNILAATYGNGVWIKKTSVWERFGKNLSSSYVNCLNELINGKIIIGTDSGVEIEEHGIWRKTGLDGETVRTIEQLGSGEVYAGTGAYHWQTKSIIGKVYTSVNECVSWEFDNSLPQMTSTGKILSLSNNTLLLGSSGLWKYSNNNKWEQDAFNFGSNRGVDITVNGNGVLFAINSTTPTNLHGGGIFRSRDKGITWECVSTGIEHQRSNFIYADKKGNVWCGLARYANKATNSTHDDATLYRSSDNGETWRKDTLILKATNYYSDVTESVNGTIYVSSGWGGPSNISSTIDFSQWNNDLNSGINNGGLAFNCASDGKGNVYLGTETKGVLRSTSGEKNSFAPIHSNGPRGNSKIFASLYTEDIVVTGGGGSSSEKYCYASSDGGKSIYPLKSIPDYTAPSDVIFSNKNTTFASFQSGNPNVGGLYVAATPLTDTTNFKRIISNGNSSYYFTSFALDECGYLIGNANNGGIYISNIPINKPSKSILAVPDDNFTVTTDSIFFRWLNNCSLNTFDLEIASDADFKKIETSIKDIKGNSFTLDNMILKNNTHYYWRITAKDTLGEQSFSNIFSFTLQSSVSITHDENTPNLLTNISLVLTTDDQQLDNSFGGKAFTLYNEICGIVKTGKFDSYAPSLKSTELSVGYYTLLVKDLYKTQCIRIIKM